MYLSGAQIESDFIHDIYARIRDPQSTIHSIFFEYTCFAPLVDRLTADASLYRGTNVKDTDHHPYVIDAVNGDTSELKIHIIESVFEAFYDALRKDIARNGIFFDPSMLNGDAEDQEEEDGDDDDDDGDDDDDDDDDNNNHDGDNEVGSRKKTRGVKKGKKRNLDEVDSVILRNLQKLNTEDSSKQIIREITVKIAGYAADRACRVNGLTETERNALARVMLCDITVALSNDIPIERLKQPSTDDTPITYAPCPSSLLSNMMVELERTVFTPLLSNVQIISAYGNDIVNHVKEELCMHDMVFNFISTVRDTLVTSSSVNVEQATTTFVEKFFEVYLNVVITDYERYISRMRSDSCHLRRMLGFRALVLTRNIKSM